MLHGEKVLVVCVGTFCDTALMDAAAAGLHKRGARLAWVTTRQHRDPVGASCVYRLDTPAFVTEDAGMGAADTSVDAVAWAVLHPRTALQAYLWTRRLAALLARALARHDPDSVLLHYGALPAALRLPPDALFRRGGDRRRVAALYFAPGMPNATVPWLFDARMRRVDEPLYGPTGGRRRAPALVRGSHAEYLRRLDLASSSGRALPALRRMVHVQCWSPAATPPVRPLYEGVRVRVAGAMFDRGSSATAGPRHLPAMLADGAGNRVALVSFGSFASTPAVAELLPPLLRALLRRFDGAVLHDTSAAEPSGSGVSRAVSRLRGPDRRRVQVHRGFLPYEWAVPRAALVAFTGSACLQQVCAFNRVPMLFVPVLAEQCFWARNYQHFTGVPCIPADAPADEARIDRCVELAAAPSPATRRYLASVAANMRSRGGDGVRALADMVLAARP